MASEFPPIGRGPDAIVLPAGTWHWPPDGHGLLIATDGRAIEYRAGATLDGPDGLFVHGRNGRYLMRPRLADGATPMDWPPHRAGLARAVADGAARAAADAAAGNGLAARAD